jgi:hypothetical protein
MKKIGFIDSYIDNWHADNYPGFIAKSKFGGEFNVALAWAESDPPGKKPLADWCRDMEIGRARSLEEVVAACDALVVLAPDSPERHEALSERPLGSGKPVYIDKPFAPDLAAAKRIVGRADAGRTPMMTCSALRYPPALTKALADEVAGARVDFAATRGGGHFESYVIHQLEMLVMTLGTGARRVMECGNARAALLVVDYPDGRRGSISLAPGYEFCLAAFYGQEKSLVLDNLSGFFEAFIEEMLRFFLTGENLIPRAQTLEIVALIEAGVRARSKPDTWVNVPR